MKLKIRRFLFITIITIPIFVLGLFLNHSPDPVAQAQSSFRFIAWADTKSGTGTLTSESKQLINLNPNFTIFPGDVCSSGPDASCFATWKNALNGGGTNNMFDRSFVTRGNHDASGGTFWQEAFEFASVAAGVGATNYSALNQDMTYSFDYGNAHFVGIDVLGDVTKMSAAAVSWLDNDLTAAENRGLTHAFLFWHGPIYPVDGHCCSAAPSSELLNVINKHPIISATFHGHEHVVAYAHIDSTRIPGATHQFEQFVSGDAGAGPSSAKAGRYDWWIGSTHGFLAIDVSGDNFNVSAYALGNNTPVKTWAFSKSGTPPPADTTLPTVSITAPANNSTVSDAVNVLANATDNVGVTKVEFFLDNSLKSTDTTSPYSYIWDSTTVANGTHTIIAKAYDAAGNFATASITVTVSNASTPLPTIDLKANNADGPVTVNSGGSATLSWTSANATACTASGSWSGSKAVSGSESTGALTSNKTYTLTCTGSGGSTNDSVTVNISSAPTDTTPPTVSISSPLNNATVSGTTVSIAANASDNIGVSKVEFSINNSLKFTDATSPYSYSWDSTTVTNGSHTITAKAYDAAGNFAVASVTVTVAQPTIPTAPTAPSNLTATAVSASQINLNWTDNSSNESGFKIERSINATSGFSQITTVAADITSYQNVSLVANTTYYYRVMAYNNSGDSTYSNTASATTQTSRAGSTPLKLIENNYTYPDEGWDNAIDVDTAGWDGTVTANDSPPYAIFSFNDDTTRAISRVGMMTDTGVSYEGRWVTQFTVQVSITNTNTASFTTVLNKVSKSGGNWQDYTISPAANAKYIKLILDQPNSGYRQLGEFEVYAGSPIVTPPLADTTLPTVSITAPANGSTVSSNVSIQANASDNVAVARVEFSIDNIVKATDSSSPYSYSWDTTTVANGAHTIIAKAYDAAGNFAVALVAVTVANTTTPTPDIVTLNPIADTYVAKNSEKKNYGKSQKLEVDGDPTKIAYLMFDLTALKGEQITSAKLLLRISDKSKEKQSIKLVNDTSWKEDKMTYKNKPKTSSTIGKTKTVTIKNKKYIEVSLTDAVKKKAGDKFAFAIVNSSHDGLSVYSKESSYKPQLIIKFKKSVIPPSPDTTPPTVSITAPNNNTTVSGAVNVLANATDNVGVTKVEFSIDNSLKLTDATSPYSYIWDTTTVANGSHTITAKAYDVAGNSAVASVTVTVANNPPPPPPPPPDTTPPTVSITAPVDSTTVASTVSVQANASDDVAVARTEFSIDNNVKATDSSSPYSYSWDSTTVANGSHTITAKAYDAAGNFATALVTVTVSNATPPEPDTTLPTVAVTAPNHNSTVSGAVNVLANATDDVGVTKVEFFINDSLKSTDSSNPYGYVWDTTTVANGTHTITAKAYDAAGNLAVASIMVTVANNPLPPPPPPTSGIWISAEEIAKLPMSGSAWNNVKAKADSYCGTPDLTNQDDPTNVCIMAKALVYGRTGQDSYRQGVIAAIQSIANSGTYNGRALSLGRELGAYVIAADLINLKDYDAALDNQFRSKITSLLTTSTSGAADSLVGCEEDRPNNWGNHCGASRLAVALYLGDTAQVARVAQVFKGWLGDRNSYANFSYGDLSWQCDAANPVGINPKGCSKQGHSIDGVIPDDQRRAGGFSYPPPKENYVYESLQGALAQAVMLSRAGYDVWNWQDKALLRAFQWLHTEADFPADGDDTWEPHIVNYYYATNFPAPIPTNAGKNVGWTDWTHAK